MVHALSRKCGPLVLVLLAVWDSSSHADVDRIRSRVEFMASLGSRMSGYPGADKAFEYVVEQLEKAGVEQLTRERFDLTVPVDHGGELVLPDSGERFDIKALWPNGVMTPTLPLEGLSAPLVYGGHGTFADLDGKEMDGRVVVLEFNSGNHWLNAATLGARAVVFIAPEHSSWSQANTKFVGAPLNFPRFWLDREAGQRLSHLLQHLRLPYCYVRLSGFQHSQKSILPVSDRFGQVA